MEAVAPAERGKALAIARAETEHADIVRVHQFAGVVHVIQANQMAELMKNDQAPGDLSESSTEGCVLSLGSTKRGER